MIPARTRVNITPAWMAGGPEIGIDFDLTKGLTLGNLWVAKLNYEIARLTGGDFEVQWQEYHAQGQGNHYADVFMNHGRAQCEAAILQMEAFGIHPDAVTYEMDTFPLSWRVWNRMPFSNYLEGQNYYLGLTPCNRPGTMSMNLAPLHPWWITSMVVSDMVSGRNFGVHGMDCIEGHSAYNLIAWHVQQTCTEDGDPFFPTSPVPKLVSVPLLLKEDGSKISGSDPVVTNRFFVKSMIDAGLEPSRLWSFLERKCFRGGRGYENLVIRGASQESFMKAFNSDVIITNKEWDDLIMSTTHD